jgi:tetratricopeptide (TPR) repeat protein
MTPRLPAACLLAVAILAAAPAVGRAQTKPKAAPRLAARWTEAVRTHTPGEVDEALRTVQGWSEAQTLVALRPTPDTPSDAAFLHRALSLHTDIAIVERSAFDRDLPPSLAGKVLLLDPTRPDAAGRAFQWRAARAIAGQLAALPSGAAAVRLWYRATSAMLQQWGDCATLRPHLRAGLDAMPDDPVLLLADGTLHQTFADPRVRAYLDATTEAEQARFGPRQGVRIDGSLRTGSGVTDRVVVVGMPRGVADRVGAAAEHVELERAEQAFRDALAQDAALVEARIRLAHVLLRRQRPADALGALQPLAGTTLSPVLDYYRAMVLGSVLDALGRHREALAVFERAAAALPGAQAARVAVSRQALVDGHPVDGLRSLVDGLGPQAPRGAAAGDPWYDYIRFHDPDARTLLAGFRTTAP